MPTKSRDRATAPRIVLAAAGLVAAVLLSGCAQDVCAGRQNDVVGCGGHWDEIYRQIRYPQSPGG